MDIVVITLTTVGITIIMDTMDIMNMDMGITIIIMDIMDIMNMDKGITIIMGMDITDMNFIVTDITGLDLNMGMGVIMLKVNKCLVSFLIIKISLNLYSIAIWD